MKISGWLFMLFSWGFILWLFVFSFSRILKKRT